MTDEVSCLLVDVIKTTLDTCSWQECSEDCQQYLWSVAFECPEVFHNLTYRSLWDTLIHICFPQH